MKICFFANANNVHAQTLAAGLSERNHLVHVVNHNPVQIPGVSVERFRVPRPSLTNPRRWQGRWERYLRGFLRRFDVCVVFFLHDWGFTPEMLNDGCLIASPRGSDVVPPPGETPPAAELIEKRIALMRHAAGVGVGGPTFAAIVADFASIEANRIDILPLGVDLTLFRPPDFSSRKATDGPWVGFFKGFREVYGAEYLVRAIPVVIQAVPGVRFELIGDGPTLARCKALAHELEVDSVIQWTPRQPHHKIPAHLAGWDLSVMPSLCESFGLAALESSAMRVPVVASRVGGMVDTVRDGVTGLLVEPGSPQRLADAITSLLRDHPMRERMGIAGRALVQREYEWGKVLNDWLTVFRKAQHRVCLMV